MKYRKLPGTDLELSVVGFGGWAIGGDHWGDDVTDDRSALAIYKALDLGINWFDTAPIYGRGHSEEVLAKTLRARPNDAMIATKVGVDMSGEHVQSLLTAAHVRRDLEATLTRLGTDRIDLLQVHWPCESGTPFEETFGELDKLREEGKFRYLGVCNYNAGALRQIAEITSIVSLQTGWSLLRREAEAGLSATAVELGLGVLAYEPLARGLLTGKFAAPPVFPESDMRARDDRFKGGRFFHGQGLARDLVKVARKVGVPPAAIAVGWVLDQPGVTSVIVGAKGPEQVAQNVRAAELIGRHKLWAVVSKIAAVHGGTPR